MGWDGHHLNLILYSTLFIEDSLSETHWSMNDRWKPGRKEKGFMQNISQVSPTPVLTRVPDTWHVTRDTWLRQFSLSDRFSRLMTCCRGGQTSLIRLHHLPTSTFGDVIFMKSLVFQTCGLYYFALKNIVFAILCEIKLWGRDTFCKITLYSLKYWSQRCIIYEKMLTRSVDSKQWCNL